MKTPVNPYAHRFVDHEVNAIFTVGSCSDFERRKRHDRKDGRATRRFIQASKKA